MTLRVSVDLSGEEIGCWVFLRCRNHAVTMAAQDEELAFLCGGFAVPLNGFVSTERLRCHPGVTRIAD